MSISLQSSFNALSRVIEQFESDGNAVRRVEAATPTTKSETGAQPLTATIYTPLSSQLQPLGTNDESTDVDSDSEVDSTRITAEMTDGRVCISYMLPSLRPPEIDISVKIQSVDAEVSGDEIILRIEVDIGERYANSNPTSDESTTAESRLDNRDHGDESDTENSRMRYKSHKSSDSAWSPPSAEGVFGGSITNSEMKKNATDGLMTATDTVEGRVDDSGITVDDELSQVRNDSIPPYEDETYLQRLYETCDTFSEMSDKIELDVAGETVRRYMIEADVHSPTRYNDTVDGDAESPETESNDEETEADGSTSTDSVHIKDNCTNADSSPSTDVSADSADQMSVGTDHNEQRHTPRPDAVDNITETETLSIPDEQLVTDGAGLPSELEVDDLIDAVVGARTVYEVQRRLGIEYRQTRDLLDQLDILDLVLRRVSGGPDPDCGVSYEAIATRIEQYTQT